VEILTRVDTWSSIGFLGCVAFEYILCVASKLSLQGTSGVHLDIFSNKESQKGERGMMLRMYINYRGTVTFCCEKTPFKFFKKQLIFLFKFYLFIDIKNKILKKYFRNVIVNKFLIKKIMNKFTINNLFKKEFNSLGWIYSFQLGIYMNTSKSLNYCINIC
jgi:hypothetical protein